MLYRYSEVFRSMLLLADLSLVALCWVAAYGIRFTFFPAPRGVPEFQAYLPLLAIILPLWLGLFQARRLYEPQRTASLLSEAGSVLGATALGTVMLVAVTFFLRSYFYSRGVILIFFLLSASAGISFRVAGRLLLRAARRRGYNLRFVLLVGAGRLAEEVIDRIHGHPEAGMRVVGVLAEGAARRANAVRGVPVIADYASVKGALQRLGRVDQVILALPREHDHHLEKIVAELDDEVVDLQIAPDLLQIRTLGSSVENLDGLPMIHLRESPLVGWAALYKRSFDLLVASFALIALLPLAAAIAVALWSSGGRPVLYRQERMGLDGRLFRMLKFRSMREGAEEETGPVWATAGDSRSTRLGRLLRRTSLDELPQLWNVVRGDMSLVGPRPERPVFIEQFRRELPGYMLRHKVRAGLTGWAQIHGWRGNTSLHERLEHDIYYIQNWSPGLDIRILLLTLWRVWRQRDAY